MPPSYRKSPSALGPNIVPIDYVQLGRLLGQRERMERGLGLALGMNGPDHYGEEQARIRGEQQQAGALKAAYETSLRARAEREAAHAMARREEVEDKRREREYDWKKFSAGEDAANERARLAREKPPAPPGPPTARQKMDQIELDRREVEDELVRRRASGFEGGPERDQEAALFPSERTLRRREEEQKRTDAKAAATAAKGTIEERLRLAREAAGRSVAGEGRERVRFAERLTPERKRAIAAARASLDAWADVNSDIDRAVDNELRPNQEHQTDKWRYDEALRRFKRRHPTLRPPHELAPDDISEAMEVAETGDVASEAPTRVFPKPTTAAQEAVSSARREVAAGAPMATQPSPALSPGVRRRRNADYVQAMTTLPAAGIKAAEADVDESLRVGLITSDEAAEFRAAIHARKTKETPFRGAAALPESDRDQENERRIFKLSRELKRSAAARAGPKEDPRSPYGENVSGKSQTWSDWEAGVRATRKAPSPFDMVPQKSFEAQIDAAKTEDDLTTIGKAIADVANKGVLLEEQAKSLFRRLVDRREHLRGPAPAPSVPRRHVDPRTERTY